jgi:hypothetical protein
VNTRHRHPVLWAALEAGAARVWQAREVARRCAAAGLDLDQARWVDAVTTPYLVSLPWGRFESLLEAKIVEADPAAAEERARAAALARFVRTGQSSEFGLKTLVARAAAGDVVFFVAMVDRIAAVLLLGGDTDPVDVRRSKAIGILATPARALVMLQQAEAAAAAEADAAAAAGASDGGRDASESDDDETYDDTNDAADDTDGTTGDPAGDDSGGAGESVDAGAADATAGTAGDPADDPEVVGELDVHPSENDADDPAPQTRPCPACDGAGTVTGDPAPFTRPGLGGLAGIDPKRLLPDATLYIHVSAEALRSGVGVARMEGVGPITIGQVREFLGHCHVRPVSVVDLADQRPVDGYEVPARMGEALWLRNPACVSPYGTNLGRGKDKDHVVPYLPPDTGGPPGQTSMENLALLSRFVHRVKTHGRWSLRQPSPGVYEWRTPHGYWFRVDHRGTHPLGKNPEQHQDHQHDDRHGERHEAARSQDAVVDLWHSPLELDLSELVAHAN